ncbi:MAG: OmpH family outer membrane protein [Vulcanimicrobiaceae bacterium]
MKTRFIHLCLAATVATAALTPAAIAADLTGVGYLNQAQVGSLPTFAKANTQLAQAKAVLDRQFVAAMKGAKTDADRQRVALEFQQKFSDKQNELMGPVLERTQMAIAQVAAKNHLSIVVDKRIVVYGGENVTKAVVALLSSSQAITAPTATPPPSEIGFVDNNALDSLPTVKEADQKLSKYVQAQRKIYEQRFNAAKNNAERTAVAASYNKKVAAKQKQLLQPLVDKTRSATAAAAKKKGLLVVIDRADVVFGGVDITKDVQNALLK